MIVGTKCPSCKSKHTVKAGFKVLVGGRKARRQCQKCGRTFYPRARSGRSK